MIGVSVIICCYNSSTRIVPTLEHLLKQKVPHHILWEVIVVNNASTDNTTETVKGTWNQKEGSVSLHIADQPIPGLSFAREKGIEKAAFEYLLFCDDDNWLDENYIVNVFEIMKENEQIGALAGLGFPYFETKPSDSILKYAGTYATGPLGTGTGEVTHAVYGAGCTYRKSAVISLFQKGFKYLLTGRNGNTLLCGEDHELCYALYLSGYQIWASDKLTFFHFIPNSRISFNYIKRNLKGIYESKFVVSIYQILVANKQRKRPVYKSRWEWAVAVRGTLLTKKFFEAKSKDDLPRFELKADLKSYSFLLRNRNLFNKTFNTLSKSKWINGSINEGVGNDS
ncbi:MAG: glycosyltransferase [Segetibacter sp.]